MFSKKDGFFHEVSKVLGPEGKRELQDRTKEYFKGRLDEGALFHAFVEILGKRLVSEISEDYTDI